MEINTPIAEDIHATDQNAQYDAACKRLLSQKIILAWIMKSCLQVSAPMIKCKKKVVQSKKPTFYDTFVQKNVTFRTI